MGPGEAGATPQIVGRDDVRRRVLARLAPPGPGGCGSVILTGEPGVGKTTLAKDAVARLADAAVFAGSCLPLSTVSVPMLAFRSMFRLVGADSVADFDAAPASALLQLDAWLDEQTADQRVVLLVDDLQWADSAMLDALLYLMSGPPARGLSIIATVRDESTTAPRPVDRWLSNARHVESCEVVAVEPLDRAGTTEQLAALLGRSPHQTLVEEVWAHTRGFPYFTALTVEGIDPDARRLPPALPSRLAEAVLAPAHELGEAVAGVLRVLAVGGRPLTANELHEVVAAVERAPGPRPADIENALATGAEAGIVGVGAHGSYWFRHPLSAEMLAAELAERERTAWHAAFVRRAEVRSTEGASFEDVIRLADHAEESGDADDAYRWAVAACRAALVGGSFAQALRFADRALQWHPRVDAPAESQRELLELRRRAAADAGDGEAELETVESLLRSVEPEERRLRLELDARRLLLRAAGQLSEPTEHEVGALCARVRAEHADWEDAFALAVASLWMPAADAAVAAHDALGLARATDHDVALAWSLTASVHSAERVGDTAQIRRLAPEALRAAVRIRDGLAHNMAVNIAATASHPGRPDEFADAIHRARVTASGTLPSPYVGWLGMWEATDWFLLGRWDRCRAALRSTLSEYPGRPVDVASRAVAGWLAVRQGRAERARTHFARADELIAEGELVVSPDDVIARAELELALGDTGAAARLVDEASSRREAKELVPVAARVLADHVRSGAPEATLPAAVRDLARRELPTDRTADTMIDGREYAPVWERLQRAELARAGSVDDSADRWLEAAEACAGADLPWEEAYCCEKAAEALLIAVRPDRARAAEPLRRGLAITDRLGARPLGASLRQLALSARIPLPGSGAGDEASARPLPPFIDGLTPREIEIVRLVVAGRTYREIAGELFVSEKTVSSHISNVLRKTGAANRIDLARRAAAVMPPS